MNRKEVNAFINKLIKAAKEKTVKVIFKDKDPVAMSLYKKYKDKVDSGQGVIARFHELVTVSSSEFVTSYSYVPIKKLTEDDWYNESNGELSSKDKIRMKKVDDWEYADNMDENSMEVVIGSDSYKDVSFQ